MRGAPPVAIHSNPTKEVLSLVLVVRWRAFVHAVLQLMFHFVETAWRLSNTKSKWLKRNPNNTVIFVTVFMKRECVSHVKTPFVKNVKGTARCMIVYVVRQNGKDAPITELMHVVISFGARNVIKRTGKPVPIAIFTNAHIVATKS